MVQAINMASIALSIHCWIKLVILVAGQAMLRINPTPPELPLISSYGNKICDPATEILKKRC